MKSVLLIGLGRIGRCLLKELSSLGDDVLVIDIDEGKVNDALKYATNAQIGDATNEDCIKSLGVSDFDLCIVTTGTDFESSLVTTALLKENGAKFVLSQATNERQAQFLKRNGADEVLFMEQQIAHWVSVTYSDDRIFDYVKLSSDIAIFETSLPKGWAGKSVFSLDVRRKFNVNILGVKKNGILSLANDPNRPFEEGETVLLLGCEKDVRKVLK